MKRVHYAMFVGALLWFGIVVWYIVSNTIARDIPPLGAIAHALDRLPEAIGTPIFILMWLIFLLGWIVPLILGGRPFFACRSRLSN